MWFQRSSMRIDFFLINNFMGESRRKHTFSSLSFCRRISLLFFLQENSFLSLSLSTCFCNTVLFNLYNDPALIFRTNQTHIPNRIIYGSIFVSVCFQLASIDMLYEICCFRCFLWALFRAPVLAFAPAPAVVAAAAVAANAKHSL